MAKAPDSDELVLNYWKRQSTYFPTLPRIARDVLAVPVSSVQSERENSKAKYVITDVRNRMSSPVIQATLCLKFWKPLFSLLEPKLVVLIGENEVDNEGDYRVS